MKAPCSAIHGAKTPSVLALGRPRRITVEANRRAGLLKWRQRSEANSGSSSTTDDGLNYGKLLLAIADANPYLSEGSRQALKTTANLALAHQSNLTVLVVDEENSESDDATMRYKVIDNQLQSFGCQFDLLSKSLDSKCSAILGDVVDEINADLLVLSSDTVHDKTVDANLLAEFVSCPVLLIP